MNCASCKHWERKPEVGGWERIRDQPPERWGECQWLSLRYFWKPDHRERRALAGCDGEGIYGELYTREDFGCADFEPT